MEKLLWLIIILTLFSGCTWENEETLYPESVLCDTLNVSYSQDVVPVLAENCYSCHSNSNAPDFAEGIAFENFEDAYAYGSAFVGTINHLDGFPSMPKDNDKLDTCSISIIEAWVNMGAPEN